jgi:hypothetical protein
MEAQGSDPHTRRAILITTLDSEFTEAGRRISVRLPDRAILFAAVMSK